MGTVPNARREMMRTTPPAVEKMSRASDVMPQEDAMAYASKLTPSQRMDVGGCYVVRCVPCGLCPVGLHYACGGSSLCWGCGTTPFACCCAAHAVRGPLLP